MSNGMYSYECICGGTVTEGWDNDAITIYCENHCEKPYPNLLWIEIENDIKNAIKYTYKDVTYYLCGDVYYLKDNVYNGKVIYNSYQDEESLKRAIDNI